MRMYCAVTPVCDLGADDSARYKKFYRVFSWKALNKSIPKKEGPMPTLATTVDGLKLPNPFVIGSGPSGTNLNVITKAFKEGWGAVIARSEERRVGKEG